MTSFLVLIIGLTINTRESVPHCLGGCYDRTIALG